MKVKKLTIKDLFFTLPKETNIPAQRCRYLGPSGPTTVMLCIVKKDRQKQDRDGLIEYSTELFEKLPIATWAGSVLINERDLPRIR